MRLAPSFVSASPRHRRVLGTLALLLVAQGCGGSTSAPATASAAEPSVETPSMPPQPRREGEITREELLPILEGGLGRFLGGVGTEPEIEAGRFVGWRIVRLYPDDPRFQGIALQPGDVVTRVNALPIERPEQAFQVWDGLRVASELVVDYRRDGDARQMRYAIVD